MLPDSEEIVKIFLFAQGADDHGQFTGALPGGIGFDWERSQIRDRLGPPARAVEDTDQWIVGSARLFVEYAEDRIRCIALVRSPR